MHFWHHEPEPDLFKGLLAGFAGGLVGTVAMTAFQAAASSLSEQMRSERDRSDDFDEPVEDPTTVKAASAVTEGVLGHEMSRTEKTIAGPSVHFGFGAIVGTIYGVVAEYLPLVTVGEGAPFGTAVMIGADEAVIPAVGLSAGPMEQPLTTHGYSFASHLVYGVTTELVRRAVRHVLG